MATPIPFPTINVVPAGYRWSLQAAQKAQEKGAFIHVGGTQVTRRFLSGAERKWKSPKPEENRTAFHTSYRITGTPEDIQTALTYARVPAEEIAQVMATLITRDNYQTTMKQVYDQELAAYDALKKEKPVVDGYEFDQILWLAQNIKSANYANKAGDNKGVVAAPGRAGAGDTLGDKLRKLGPGKVLDVSNMDTNTGKGVRTVPAPKTSKSGKYGTGTIPIISNDLNKYIRALQLGYGADAERTYAADIEMVRRALSNVGAPGAPGGTVQFQALPRAPSPRQQAAVVPGTTLAPLPQFRPATAVPNVASPRLTTIGGTQLPQMPALGQLLG
jgi:hypothetical protein